MTARTPPVFIFSSSWRSGSTLLQRYITRSKEILVWGETGGALNAIAQALAGWEKIGADTSLRFDHTLGGGGAAAYRALLASSKEAHASQWIANLVPPYEDIEEAMRSFFDALYGSRARELGYPRYGFKETRCDIQTAKRLHQLYPGSPFIFLVRNPIDVMTSIKRRSWMGRPAGLATLKYYSDHWLARSRQFRESDLGLTLRYEDFVADAAIRTKVLEHVQIGHPPPADFIAESRVDWEPINKDSLSRWERLWLHRWLGKEMQHWGY